MSAGASDFYMFSSETYIDTRLTFRRSSPHHAPGLAAVGAALGSHWMADHEHRLSRRPEQPRADTELHSPEYRRCGEWALHADGHGDELRRLVGRALERQQSDDHV